MRTIQGLISLVITVLFVAALFVVVDDPEHVDQNLAAVGVIGTQIGVAPNPYNTLAEELRAKEETLAVRENYLKSREAAPTPLTQNERILLYAFVGGGGLLLLLLLLNLYWDYEILHKIEGNLSEAKPL